MIAADARIPMLHADESHEAQQLLKEKHAGGCSAKATPAPMKPLQFSNQIRVSHLQSVHAQQLPTCRLRGENSYGPVSGPDSVAG